MRWMASHLPALQICDRARLARDARFDGIFFTAIRTTKIYCRPICPAPTPKPQNVVYFATAASAMAAGFRPCLRCRPELAPGVRPPDSENVIYRALTRIRDGALQEGSMESLAQSLGLSGRQLRRVFKNVTGASPIAVHTTQRLHLAKQLLAETSLPVTHVALAAGFNSLRRFNAVFRDGCGVPPSQVRKTQRKAISKPLTLRLGFRPPFDFSATLQFLAKRAIHGIEQVAPDCYERVVGPAQSSSWLRLSRDPARAELRLDLFSVEPQMIPQIVCRVRRMFDLDANLESVHSALNVDPVLRNAVANCPGLRVPGGWDGFEIAVRAVLGQQVSVAAATTLCSRLVKEYGFTRNDGKPGLDWTFPSPEALRSAPLEKIGLPQTRAHTVRELARAVSQGKIDFTAGQTLDRFVANMVALPGVGPWTAHYIALRALSHPDAFPAGDLVLQKILGEKKRLTERQTEARSQAWRPWRAYAVMYLWRLANDTRSKHVV